MWKLKNAFCMSDRSACLLQWIYFSKWENFHLDMEHYKSSLFVCASLLCSKWDVRTGHIERLNRAVWLPRPCAAGHDTAAIVTDRGRDVSTGAFPLLACQGRTTAGGWSLSDPTAPGDARLMEGTTLQEKKGLREVIASQAYNDDRGCNFNHRLVPGALGVYNVIYNIV